jgi:hypothetical protein
VNGERFLFLINWRFSDDNQKNAAHFGRRVKHFLKFIFVTGKEKSRSPVFMEICLSQ